MLGAIYALCVVKNPPVSWSAKADDPVPQDLSISTTTNGYCWVPAVAGMTPRRSSQRRAVISISTSFPGRENPSTSSISAFSSGTGASAATVSSRSSGS